MFVGWRCGRVDRQMSSGCWGKVRYSELLQDGEGPQREYQISSDPLEMGAELGPIPAPRQPWLLREATRLPLISDRVFSLCSFPPTLPHLKAFIDQQLLQPPQPRPLIGGGVEGGRSGRGKERRGHRVRTTDLNNPAEHQGPGKCPMNGSHHPKGLVRSLSQPWAGNPTKHKN